MQEGCLDMDLLSQKLMSHLKIDCESVLIHSIQIQSQSQYAAPASLAWFRKATKIIWQRIT